MVEGLSKADAVALWIVLYLVGFCTTFPLVISEWRAPMEVVDALGRSAVWPCYWLVRALG